MPGWECKCRTFYRFKELPGWQKALNSNIIGFRNYRTWIFTIRKQLTGLQTSQALWRSKRRRFLQREFGESRQYNLHNCLLENKKPLLSISTRQKAVYIAHVQVHGLFYNYLQEGSRHLAAPIVMQNKWQITVVVSDGCY